MFKGAPSRLVLLASYLLFTVFVIEVLARSSGRRRLQSVASDVHIVMSVLTGQAGEKDRTEAVCSEALKALGLERKPAVALGPNRANILDQALIDLIS